MGKHHGIFAAVDEHDRNYVVPRTMTFDAI